MLPPVHIRANTASFLIGINSNTQRLRQKILFCFTIGIMEQTKKKALKYHQTGERRRGKVILGSYLGASALFLPRIFLAFFATLVMENHISLIIKHSHTDRHNTITHLVTRNITIACWRLLLRCLSLSGRVF